MHLFNAHYACLPRAPPRAHAWFAPCACLMLSVCGKRAAHTRLCLHSHRCFGFPLDAYAARRLRSGTSILARLRAAKWFMLSTYLYLSRSGAS